MNFSSGGITISRNKLLMIFNTVHSIINGDVSEEAHNIQ